tara:strand:- start:145 stop:417 length:273 start_codon:yes stop_codon:yes gene_type:complete
VRAVSFGFSSSSSLLTTSTGVPPSFYYFKVKETSMTKPTFQKAKYKTLCKECFQTINIGETIRVYDDKWYHNKCSHRHEKLVNKEKEVIT